MRLNFLQRGCFAQAGHIGIGGLLAKHLFDLGRSSIAAKRDVQSFAAIQAHQVGDETSLRIRPVAMGAVYLAVNMAGVDKGHGVGAGRLGFAFVEKPQGHGQSDGVKHIGAHGHHHVNRLGFNQLLAQGLLGAAGI